MTTRRRTAAGDERAFAAYQRKQARKTPDPGTPEWTDVALNGRDQNGAGYGWDVMPDDGCRVCGSAESAPVHRPAETCCDCHAPAEHHGFED